MWWVCGAFAVLGATELDRAALLRAEAARDDATLLVATTAPDDVALLARALGRLRMEAALPRLALIAGSPWVEERRAVAQALAATPGASALVRERLAVESDREVRGLLIGAVGRVGEASDLPDLIARLPGDDGPAAARAIGLLAVRGVDVQAAVPALIASLRPLRPELARAAAFALHRARPAGLTSALSAELLRSWERLPDEAARAWLVTPLLPTLVGAERRAWVTNQLGSDARLVSAAVVAGLVPGDLDAASWLALRDHPDVWVRLRAIERLGDGRLPEALASARSEVAAGRADPAQTAAVRADALTGADPRARSASALALLEGGAACDAAPLATASDPTVRELWLDAVAVAPADTSASWRCETGVVDVAATVVRASEGLSDASALAAVRAMARWPSPAASSTLATWAASGGFGLRAAAAGADDWAAVEPSVDLHVADGVRGAVVETSLGPIVLTLDPIAAPWSVAAFVTLADRGALDGLRWHRVVPGFVVQTGDPRGDGLGGPGWLLPDEPTAAPFEAGAVGIARDGYDTGGSQWFITLSPQPHLQGEYTQIGRVSRGLEVATRLSPDDRVLSVSVIREAR